MRNVRYLIPFVIVLLILAACGGGGDAEPVVEAEPAAGATDMDQDDDGLTAEEDVPEVVRDKADALLALVGEGVTCAAWYWEADDKAYECEVDGDEYAAELELGPDGAFQEIEYGFTGEQAMAEAPALAEMILSSCDDAAGAEVELSMSREEFLSQDPDLGNWWEQEGMMFEVTCPDGYEFEIDGFGVYVTDDEDMD